MSAPDPVDVAVIGGSGLYDLAPVVEERGAVSVCEVDGHRVAFLNRHGAGHRKNVAGANPCKNY